MEEAALASELNSSFQNGLLPATEYNTVQVLLIHWIESDDSAIAGEIQKLQDFFHKTLNFSVLPIPIPSQKSQAALQRSITDVIFACEKSRESLLIVYYGGHGNANPELRRATWAARGIGGPTLNWYEVQPSLYAWEGDILMILDCCYAAQAGRENDNRTVELLAASGVNKKTPPAGKYSFTSILLTVMGRMLTEMKSMTAREIYIRLTRQIRDDERVQETPVHIILAGGEESINLKPIRIPDPANEIHGGTPLALLSLTVSLSRTLDKPMMRKLQRWLRTHMPRSISAITVDQVMLKTEMIQAFLQQRAASGLHAVIAGDLEEMNQVEALTMQPILSESAHPQENRGLEIVQAQSILEQLQAWVERVYHSIETNVLLNPKFCSEQDLELLQSSKPAQLLGLSDAARLRLLHIQLDRFPDLEDVVSLPFGLIKAERFENPVGQTRAHSYGLMGDSVVIIEHRVYSIRTPRDDVIRRVKRLSKLLKVAHDPAFHIAPFVGYLHQPLEDRFGLVFQTPLKSIEPKTKHINLYEAYEKKKRLPLNLRFGMAIALARAISALHAVGWLHKSLCSEHVLIFETRGHIEEFDFTQPRLFGFDMSRPILASSDRTKEFRRPRQIYTHPKRWATPQEYFDEVHDIYALGVILLEIGCWRAARYFDKARKDFQDINDEEELREKLLGAANEYLPYLVGDKYLEAVVACLGGAFDGYSKDQEDPSRLHKAFRTLVLDVLVKGSVGL